MNFIKPLELLPLFVLISLISCKDIAEGIIITDISYQEKYNWESIHVLDQNNFVVIGGSVWENGVRISTADRGIHWDSDSIGNKTLLSLYVAEDGSGAAGGVDGNFYTFNEIGGDWKFHRLPIWDMIQDVYVYDKTFYLAYGQSFSSGRILSLNSKLDEIDNFETSGQLSAVNCNDNGCMTVGFGEFWKKMYESPVWEEQRVDSDFYTDINQVNESLVFVCGIGGSIIKSENGGETWKTLIQGNKFWSANAAFKGIDFVDHLTGIVVGENGLCQISFDGGETWKSVNGLPSVDFSDVKIYDNFAVLVGSNGTIIHLNWD